MPEGATPKPVEGKKSAKAPPIMQQPKRPTNIIRVSETNLDGSKPAHIAIRHVSGVGDMFSHAVRTVAPFTSKKLMDLNPQEMATLIDIIQHPEKYNIPSWLYNRRKDPIKGTNVHLVASTLDFTHKMDINDLKKLRTYKGVRHSLGLPVRGQRTRSSFRGGATVGVKRDKQQPAKAAAAGKDDKKK